MSGRERLNEILRTGTIITVFLLVGVQFALFMAKAVPEWRSRGDVPCAAADSLSAEDAAVSDGNAPGSPEGIRSIGTGGGAGRRPAENRKTADSRREAEDDRNIRDGREGHNAGQSGECEPVLEGRTPPQGDGGWKWDVVELNSADSAELVSLPGIGAYYARSILKYRERLGSFVSADQLLEIRGIDSAKYDRLKGRVRVDMSAVRWLDLDNDSIEVLARHPYVGSYAAGGIERLRRFSGGNISPQDLVTNGIISEEAAARLSRYVRK